MPIDDVIEAALAPLRPITRRSVPVEGHWAPPPFPDRVVDGRPVAVICAGPGLSAIVVDREDGRVLHLDADERPWSMNSSVDLFVASVRAYQRAALEADRAESGGSEEAVDEIAERLRAEIARIDPPAMDDHGAIWPWPRSSAMACSGARRSPGVQVRASLAPGRAPSCSSVLIPRVTEVSVRLVVDSRRVRASGEHGRPTGTTRHQRLDGSAAVSNPVTWWEIQVPELGSAKAFYGGLFGWTFKLWREGYEGIHVGDTMIGGMVQTEGDAAGRHINVVFNLDLGDDTLESAMEKVVRLGGEVQQERTHIGGDMGWYASVADPSGLRFDLWTGRDKV